MRWFNRSAIPASIREELEHHIADMAAELVASGISEDDATAQAREAFGDIDAIAHEVETIDGYHLFNLSRLQIGSFIYSAVGALGFMVLLLAPSAIIGTRAEWWLLLWVYGAVIALGSMGVRWIAEYRGLQSSRVLWDTFIVTHAVAAMITIWLDIDKFENNLHGMLFSLLLFVPLQIAWKWIPLSIRQISLYFNNAVVLWAVLTDSLLFQFLGHFKCLYLTPDDVPLSGALADCSQVGWLTFTLVPFYGLMLIGGPWLLQLLASMWRNKATALHRKVVLTASFVILPITPLFATDINNKAELDIVPYKPAIYEAYHDILEREPEAKDLEFYAQTRSYVYPERIREALNDSEERRIKINLVYEEELLRSATKAEIDAHVESAIPVQQLRQILTIEHLIKPL